MDEDFKTNELYSQVFLQEGIHVTLQNKELWNKFHQLETEMIVTKSGRRMFPSLRVQVGGLDPEERYCFLLEFAAASPSRLKYSSSGGWAAAGSEEIQSSRRIYLHPDSPAPGSHWMNEAISFSRVKLTNSPSPPTGHVVLSSMHKYQPRILIVKAADSNLAPWAPSLGVVFAETEFIAVTAYQNERITQLKIDNNPFAKGFRENGQSRCKRKEKEVCEKSSNEQTMKSQPQMNKIESKSSPAASYQLLYSLAPYSTPFEYSTYFTPTPQVFHQSHHFQIYPPANYRWYENHYTRPQMALPPVQRPRTFTDFSIRAITGNS